MTTEHPDQAAAPAPAAEPVANPAAAPAIKALDPRAMLKRLQAETTAFRECKPLALKIDAAILTRFPDFDRKNLRVALRMHTASTRYLKAVERSRERFDLDGTVAGEVTEEQRLHAATTLKERFAEVARQQREKRAAEAAEQRRLEQEQRKEEKLRQLLTKFGR